MSNKVALIIGAGPGISLAFAKQLIASGYLLSGLFEGRFVAIYVLVGDLD